MPEAAIPVQTMDFTRICSVCHTAQDSQRFQIVLLTLRDPELIAVYNSGSRYTVRRVQRVEQSEIECNPPESKATGIPLPIHGTGALPSHGCMMQQHRMPDGSSTCESPSMYSLETSRHMSLCGDRKRLNFLFEVLCTMMSSPRRKRRLLFETSSRS